MFKEIDWLKVIKAVVKALLPFFAGGLGGAVAGCTVGGIGPNFFGA